MTNKGKSYMTPEHKAPRWHLYTIGMLLVVVVIDGVRQIACDSAPMLPRIIEGPGTTGG